MLVTYAFLKSTFSLLSFEKAAYLPAFVCIREINIVEGS